MDFRERIGIEPKKRGGKPCIRGLRISVSDVLDFLAAGMSEDEILTDFPDLERADIRAALTFAAERAASGRNPRSMGRGPAALGGSHFSMMPRVVESTRSFIWVMVLVGASALFLATAASLPAQTVAGRAVALSTGRVLAGSAAALVDDSGHIVTRGRTDADGVFALQAATAGRYRVVLFVAGGSFVSPAFELGAGGYIEREFAIPEIPESLGELFFATDVDRPAVSRPGNPVPRYPESLRNRRRRGLVSAMFVVDSAGRVNMSTFQILTDGPRQFSEAVRDILPEWSFDPAERGGIKVPQVVQLTFDFGIGDDPPRGDIVIRALGITRVRIRSSPRK